MSTADAMLMNASSAVVHDLLTDYVDIDGDRLMLYTRGVTVLIGILVVGLTISPPALILTLAILALALFIGGFLTPVMIGLYTDERSDVAGAIAMGIGVVSVVLTHPDTPAIQLATQAYAGIAGAGLALVAYVLVNRIVSPQAPSGTPVGDD
jgi:Na+/proline symporter